MLGVGGGSAHALSTLWCRTFPNTAARTTCLFFLLAIHSPLIGSSAGSFIFRRTVARWRPLDPIWLGRLFSDKERIPADSLAGYRAPVLERCQFEHAIGIVSTWTADLRELEMAIRKISHYPTLLMWGEQDPAVLFESAERLRRNFDRCKLVTFRGVGHLPYEEAPDQFNSALLEYLEETRNFTIG
jgi:pimeloyl-ACP methyl ester carboxylesterase